jgi:3-phosphoshikimate 1-carboxyvinyltransferase
MNYKINGQGIISLPGSKSIAIRSLIIATLLREPLKLINFPQCNDCLTLQEALQELGFMTSRESNTLLLTPPEKINRQASLYIKDSAAALRFLAFRLAAEESFVGDISFSTQLAKRPLEPMIEIINSMGGNIILEGNRLLVKGSGSLEFNQATQKLSNKYAGLSSQFLSGILLSAPLYKKGLRVELPDNLVSTSYLELTWTVMKSFGMKVRKERNILHLSPRESHFPGYTSVKEFRIEEDFSSACYFWAIGALSREYVGIETEFLTSRQPDFSFLKLLQKMGAEVRIDSGDRKARKQSITVKAAQLNGIEVDMKDMPDQVPTLTVLALFAANPTKIRNISHLRCKESDRISALVTELRKIGAEIKYENETLYIEPLRVTVAAEELNTHEDHRLVMALSILTLVFKKLQLDSTKPVTKSFPGFFEKLKLVLS